MPASSACPGEGICLSLFALMELDSLSGGIWKGVIEEGGGEEH